MVEIVEGAYFLPEWEKHQNLSGLAKIREQTRQRVARHRAKAKSVTLHVTQSNAAETETEIELEKQQHEIRFLLNNTPLCRISDDELRSLVYRHGSKQLMLAADIAAETWRREKHEIQNPGGYLNSFCSALITPSWYRSLEDRRADAEAIEEKRLATLKAKEKQIVAEEKEACDREAFWASISEAERDNFRRKAKESMNPGLELPGAAIAAIAKSMAWENRTQLNTNVHSSPT